MDNVLTSYTNRLLVTLLLLLGAVSVSFAQETPAALTFNSVDVPTVYEYYVVPESSPGVKDDYIKIETGGLAGASVLFSATLNGQKIAKTLRVDDSGYARLQSPDMGIYEDVSISHNGKALARQAELLVMSRSIGDVSSIIPSLEDRDIEYAGKPLQSANLNKVSGCQNNKLSNVGFESGISGWSRNSSSAVVVVNNTQPNEFINSGSRALKLDLHGGSAWQNFSMSAHRNFCFSAYAKNHATTGIVSLTVRFLRSNGSVISEVSEQMIGFSGYNLYQIDGITPTGTARVEVIFFRDEHTNNDSWIDDVCFQDKGSVVDGGTPPTSFMADCGDGRTVDAYVSDVDCSSSPQAETIIPSSSNVYQVVAEVVYKGANPGPSTTVLASDGNEYLVSKANVQNNGNSSFHIYRGLIPASVSWVRHSAANGQCTNNSQNNSGLQSLASFAFRNITVERAGAGIFTALTGFNSIAEVDIPIPTSSLTRDVTLRIPFSEITLDGRYVKLNARVNGVVLGSRTWTFGPSGGDCCIDLLEFSVPNVPGGASVITVEVDTRNGMGPGGVNGQSYTLAGLSYADIDCPVSCTTVVDAGDDVSICEGDQTVLNATVTGAVNCSSSGVSDCNHELEASGGYVLDASSAAYCGSSVGAKLWTAANQGTSFVTIDFGVSVPSGTQICVNMKLEHCSSSASNVSSARIQSSQSPTSGFTNLVTAETFNNNYFTEFCYTLGSSARYVKVIDNGSCSILVDYVRYETQGQSSNAISYQWSGPGIVGASNRMAVIVNQPGNYVVNVTDCSGCTATDVVRVNSNANPEITCYYDIGAGYVSDACAATVCEGGYVSIGMQNVGLTNVSLTYPNGFVDATPDAGTVWNFNNVTSAQAGTYVLRYTNGSGCTATKNFTLTVNPSPEITCFYNIGAGYVSDACAATVCEGGYVSIGMQNVGVTNVSLTYPNGFVDATPDAGTVWNFNNVTSAQGGTYVLRYTNGNGCTATKNFTLTVNPSPDLNQFISVDGTAFQQRNTVTVCEGQTVLLDMGGSFGTDWTFTYTRPDGAIFPGGTNGVQNDQIFLPNLTDGGGNEGVWQVTYTNPQGCTNTETFTININPNPDLDPFIGSDGGPLQAGNTITICEGSSVLLDFLGSFDAGWTFVYTRPDGRNYPGGTNGVQNDQIFLPPLTDGGVNEGVWQVTYTNPQGCTNTETFTININPNPEITCYYNIGDGYVIDDCAVAICEGEDILIGMQNVGVTNVSLTYPNGFVDDTPDFGTVWNFNNVTSAQGGTYVLRYTNGNGCTATKNFTLTVKQLPIISSITSTDPTCGQDNGTITINFDPVPGRTQIQFSLDGGVSYESVVSISNGSVTYSDLAVGTYDVLARFGNGGCPISVENIELINQAGPNAGIQISINPLCAGDANGRIIVRAPNSGTAPFTYTISPQAGSVVNLRDFRELPAGTYTFTVTDANGCTASVNRTLTDPEELVASADDTSICFGESVNLSASATGGTAPISFAWDQGAGEGASVVVTPTVTTTYTVTATDANGCTTTDIATVTVNENPVVEIESTDDNGTTCAGEEVELTASISLGAGPFSIEWTVNDDATVISANETLTVDPTETTTYKVKVTDANGCMDTDEITITVDPTACARLGDYVWVDTNGNGINDEPASAGVDGVTVNLKDEDGVVIATTTTMNGGFYEFTNLVPGTYSVAFELPAGFLFTGANAGAENVDSDAAPTGPMQGMTETVVLEEGDNNEDLDAGLFETASLGDFVFLDENANGQQDAEDEGIEGVVVNLLVKDIPVATTTTDATGFYEFTDLTPGEEYEVEFDDVAGLERSPSNAGDDASDSDADETTGLSQVVVLESGENNPTIDAGFFETASLGDFVFEDTNGNGIQDTDEPGVENVVVNLKDEDGVVIATTTTDENGAYIFEDLTPGTYSVQFVLPADYAYTTLGAVGSDETNDSDADPAMDGMTDPVTLESGDNNLDLDAGIQRNSEITLDKEFVSAVPNADGTYDVTYTIAITNAGGIGTYSLTDTPLFDADVTINSGAFSGADAGALEVDGPTTIATDRMIAADISETFTLVYNVTLDLEPGSTDGGDNVYTECEGGSSEGVTGTPGTGLNNRADVDTNGDGTPDLSDDDCGDLPLFDLALVKEVTSGTTYNQGDAVTYTVAITNEGDIDATDVAVTDTPETGLVFQSITPQAGVTSTGNGSFTVASLAVGATITVELTYEISATFQGTTLNNAAEITADGPFDDVDSDPTTGPDTDEDGDGNGDDDDEDEVTTPINQTYDLALTKTMINGGPFTPGSTVLYTIEVTNEGTLDAANIEVTDTPEAGLTFQSSTPDANVTVNGAGQFTIVSLPQGESQLINVIYLIDANFTGISLTNEAQITADDGDDVDSDPSTDDTVDEDGDTDPDDDDEDEVTISVEQTPSIDIEKSTFNPITGVFEDADIFDPNTPMVSPTYIFVAQEGATVQWEYEVCNNGTQDLIDIAVTDDIEGAVGTISFLAVGECETLTFSAPAISTDPVYINEATATGQPVLPDGTPDGDMVSDMDPSHYVGVSFNVEKRADQMVVCEGEDVTYDIIIRLTGPSFFNARMVMLEDNMFPNVEDQFDPSTDPNMNDRLDAGEEWVFSYTIPLTETRTNRATEMFDIFSNDVFLTMINNFVDLTVEVLDGPEATAADADVDGSISCNGASDGSATVTFSGGTPDYTILWSDGQETATATGLTAGTYGVTVTDLNGCADSTEVTLVEPEVLEVTVDSDELSCFGDTDGTLTASVVGGTAPYTFEWTDGEATATISGKAAGTYSVTVTDANGCSDTAEGTITEPASAVTASVDDSTVDCNGDTDGELTATVAGGTEPYTITWNTSPVQNGATATGLTAGTYTATVIDANGCETSAEGTITEPAELVVTGVTTDVDCNGDATGTIDVTVTGGTADYSFAWSDDATVTTEDRTGLAAADYTVTVTDANDCEVVETFTIETSSLLVATITNAELECFGDDNGELTVTVEGGTAPYTITWDTDPVQEGATATELPAGTYTATVIDASGCETEATGTVTGPAEPLTIDEEITLLECNETTGAAIDLMVSGGTAPYTYDWADIAGDDNVEDRTNLAAGTYEVVVTDANECTDIETYTIAPASVLTASIENDTICSNTTDLGMLEVVVTNGSGNYSFAWSNTGTSTTITGLTAETYTVTITDETTGCVITETGSVVEDASACASLGNFVWEDTNGNGIQDLDEPGVEGVTVNLKDEAGNVIATTMTDENGEYIFAGLLPGTYSVQFILPDGMEWTTLGAVAGANEALDSDADPAMNGMTEQVTIVAGEFYDDLDAGIVPVVACDLLAEITFISDCNDGGSSTNPRDDYYTITILVSGVSPSGQWISGTLDKDGNAIGGTVGVPVNVSLPVYDGPDPIQDVTIIVTDAQDVTCTASVDHTPQLPCSNRCRITASASSSPECNDNGTADDPTDDFFTVGVTANGLNEFGASWTVSTMGGRLVGGGIYGEEDGNVGPFTADDLVDGILRLNVQDADDPSCNFVISITIDPATLDCSEACTISIVQLGESICDNNGTPFDPSDDQWWVQAEVTGTNVTRWTSNTPGGEGNNTFNNPVSFGFFPDVINGQQTITVTSVNADPACTASIEVSAPGRPCSDECDIEVELTIGECNDNGTADPLDDFFFITVTANSVGLNNSPNGWILIEGDDRTDPVVGVGPFFNRTETFGPFLIHDADGNVRGTQSYRVEDADQYACRVDFDNMVLPQPCSEPNECTIAIVQIGEAFCNGDGTWSVQAEVTGTDLTDFTSTTAGGEGANAINQVVTFGPFSDPVNGVETITVTSVGNDPSCSDAITVAAPGEDCLPEPCMLSVEILDRICDPNGTPNEGADDIYSFQIRATGATGGYTIRYTTPVRPDERGVFGEVMTYDSISVATDVRATIIPDDPNCSEIAALFIETTGPCVNCRLEAVELSNVCSDNGTADPSDDTYTVTVQLTHDGEGNAFMVEVPGQETVTGFYENPDDLIQTFTFPISEGDVTLTFIDFQEQDQCRTTITFEAPETCSPCDIEVTDLTISECRQNGTPSDGSDDTFVVAFTVTGTNTSSSGWMTTDGVYIGEYGVPRSIAFFIDREDFTFEIVDRDDPSCTVSFQVEVPEGCVETVPCEISVTDLVTTACDPGNTPFDGSDDTFTATYTVNGNGAGYTDPTSGVTRPYGVPFTLTLPTGTENVTLVFVDADSSSCTAELLIPVPASCPGTPCEISTADLVIGACDPGTTPFDGSDDTFVFTFTVNGNGANGWIEPATGETGAYGTTVTRTLPTGTANVTLVFADADNSNCTTDELLITVPASCPTEVGTLGVSCPVSNHYCPIIEEDLMLFPMDYFDCVANFEAPVPDVIDACSENLTIITYVIDAFDLDTVQVINSNDDRGVTLPAGDYVFSYVITDECGNLGTTDCRFRVADTQEPAAICISDINVSVGGYGIARIYSQMIDLGSYDNCGIDSILVRRELLLDPITGDSLDTPIWSDWANYAEVVCEDAGTVVTLQLRVVDFGGNANICTTNATVVDNTLPYCTGLEDLFLTCDEVPFDLDATDTLSLQAAFGRPVVIDNCAAESIELEPVVNYDACSVSGTITRRWLAVDAVGNVSSQEFTQQITITSDMGFTMVLPKDTLTDCLDANQGFEIIGAGCADISVTFQDTIVEAIASDGDACLVIERKYTIINNCMFDPETDNLMVISRDEDCDGDEGESIFYAIVSGDSTYVDVDTDFGNAIPAAGTRGDECDGETNQQGRLRAFATTGGWTYTQRISIFDDTNPILNYEVPEIFCATEEEGCETVVEIPITISGECTAAGSNWLVMIDLGRDGNPEMRLQTELAVQGTFPNYFIKAAMPLGEHNLIIRYTDGCNNNVSDAIPFEIVDCSIPDPTCYSGLIANLEILETPVVDENGEEITAGVVVDAGRLASCNIEDCSGPLRYSVNRIGEVPNVDSTDVLLTCEDRYTVELEVYMWDSAFNPFSVQPDGTVGGPNWKMCVVEVLVQDPNTVCDDCNADGSLALGGSITTPQGVVLPGVEVDMEGDMTGFELTGDDGKYTFPGVPAGNYTITPYKEGRATNGVSTLDELILQRHLLGVQLITDPLVFMAADLNNSGTLTVIDRLLMRNIILGNTEVLPNNETWRFVPVSYFEEAEGGLNRMMEAPRKIDLTEVTACNLSNNFYAVKMGDLNHSVFIESAAGEILNGTRGRSSNETQQLEIEERRLQGGDLFDLPVRATDLNRISGMQFTLGFEQGTVEIEDVVPGLLNEDQLGLRLVDRGYISASWTQPEEAVAGDAILFTVRLRGLNPGMLSDAVRFIDSPTFTEAYSSGEEELMDVVLNVTATTNPDVPAVVGGPEFEAVAELGLSQNFPNPFVDETTITFDLPSAGTARLNVYDLSGRVLRDITGEFEAGVNTIKLQGRNLPTGTMLYTLTFKGERLSRTMIRVSK